jgi:hypothetical protein
MKFRFKIRASRFCCHQQLRDRKFTVTVFAWRILYFADK